MSNFTKINNAVLYDKSLSMSQKMVCVVLAYHMPNETLTCEELSEKAECSKKTALNTIKKLVEKGYIEKYQIDQILL